MAGKTQAFCDAMLGLLRGSAWTTQTAVWIALLKTNPSDDNMTSAAETTYTNYQRASMGTLSGAWNSIGGTSPRSMTNASVVNFNTAGASGDTITGFVLCKTQGGALASDGEYWNALTGGSKVINPSDPVSVGNGALTLSED